MKIQSVNDYMTQAWCKLAAFSRDEKGASGIEYVLVAAMVALIIVSFIGTGGISEAVEGKFNEVKIALTGS